MMKTEEVNTEDDVRLHALLKFYEAEADGPGPKRARLCRAMLQMIAQAFWNPGDRLPTDVELTAHLPVSVATVQGAMKLLYEQGVVTRKQREGTYVAPEKHLTRETVFFNFVRASGEDLAHVKGVKIGAREVAESGPWSEFLGYDRPYLCVWRVFDVEGEFRVFSEFYVAEDRFWALTELVEDQLLDVGLRQLLHLRFGAPTTDIEFRFALEPLSAEVSSMVGTPAGALGQHVAARLWTTNQSPLAFHQLWYPPSEYSLIVRR